MSEASCADLVRSLSAYVDGELEASQIVALDAHVRVCEECENRVLFARATRISVRNVVKSTPLPHAMRERAVRAVEETHPMRSHATPARLVSWKLSAVVAAAAGLVLIFSSFVRRSGSELLGVSAPGTPSSTQNASVALAANAVDLLNQLVDQHVDPQPPETTNPDEFARLDRYVGVRVRAPSFRNISMPVRLLGARTVPVEQQRAAMLQYVLANGSRLSVYVYDPHRIRIAQSPVLRPRVIDRHPAPVYVGSVRGYSVAITEQRGVGYALASDLDENESSALAVAVDVARPSEPPGFSDLDGPPRAPPQPEFLQPVIYNGRSQ